MTAPLILVGLVVVAIAFELTSRHLGTPPVERLARRDPRASWGRRHLRAIGATSACVVLLGAGLVARHDGLLGGRDSDGPLEGAGGGLGMPLRVGEAVGGVTFALTNEGETPVELESATVDQVSPGSGLQVRVSAGTAGSWYGAPPAQARLRAVRETRVAPGETVGVDTAFRPARGGRYFADGLTVRYRRGSRRFVEHVEGQLGACSVPRPAACGASTGDQAPGREAAPLADIGGPTTLPAGARPGGDLDEESVVIPWRASPRASVTLPLTNRSSRRVRLLSAPSIRPRGFVGPRSPVELRGVAVGRSDGSFAAFAPFFLAPEETRQLRLDLEFASCGAARRHRGEDDLHQTLAARIDDGDERSVDIPLSTPLVFRYPTRPAGCSGG